MQLTWRHGPDMPFGMSIIIYPVSSNAGRLYVGGGFAGWGSDNNCIVMEYVIRSGEWTTLPPYRAPHFAMAVISNQLVLGGEEHGGYCKVLGVWRADRKACTYPYPEMPTARSGCSVVVYCEWLVAAGGRAGMRHLSCVEILNTDSKQWYAGPPTPIPWDCMKTAVVGDMGYFMGGYDIPGSPTTKMYRVCIPTLLSHIITSKASSGTDRQIWKEIPELQLIWSTPLSFSRSLLVIGGGRDQNTKADTAIYLYQPDNGAWAKVGDLLSPCYNCTCAMTTDKEVLVAGGWDGQQQLKRVNLALIESLKLN